MNIIDSRDEFRHKVTYERILLRRPNANITLTARMLGDISKDDFEGAVIKARQKHPIIGTKIVIDDKNNGWLTNKDVPEVSIGVITKETKKEWTDISINEFKTSFKIKEGPLCRFLLLKAEKYVDIMIVCHHIIGDGLSMVYLLKDILHFLHEPKASAKELEAVDVSESLPEDFKINPIGKLIVKLLNRKWKKSKIAISDNVLEKLQHRFWKAENNIRIYNFQINSDTTKKIIDLCKLKGVSVNSLICSTFYLAEQKVKNINRPYSNIAYVPVNIRNRLNREVGEAFGLYASALKIKMPKNEGDSFWRYVSRVNDCIKKSLTNQNIFGIQLLKYADPSLVDSNYPAKYHLIENKAATRFSKLLQNDRMNASLDISNLGKLNIPNEYGKLKLKEVFGPCVYVDYHEKYIGINTFNNKMNITITYSENIISTVEIKQISTKLIETIENNL